VKSFNGVNRIRITAKGPLKGRTGTVHRRCISSNEAWVTMDKELPKKFQSFEDEGRRKNILLSPEECEEEGGGK
jgi:hypothetical protein